MIEKKTSKEIFEIFIPQGRSYTAQKEFERVEWVRVEDVKDRIIELGRQEDKTLMNLYDELSQSSEKEFTNTTKIMKTEDGGVGFGLNNRSKVLDNHNETIKPSMSNKYFKRMKKNISRIRRTKE